MKKKFRPWLVSVLLGGFLLAETRLFANGPLSDSTPLSEDYVLKTWNSYDGLPSNSISGTTQTPDGYLWIATYHGLTRFDGLRCKSFLKDDLPELESNELSTIFSSKNGVIWLGFNRGGVAKLSKGHQLSPCRLCWKILSGQAHSPRMLWEIFGLPTIPSRRYFGVLKADSKPLPRRMELVPEALLTSIERQMERFGSPLRKGADFLMERDSGRSIRAVGL
jgi:hypothetical protein